MRYFDGGCVKTISGADTDHFTLELRKEGSMDYSNVLSLDIIRHALGHAISLQVINNVARKHGAHVESERKRTYTNYFYRFPTLQAAKDAAEVLNSKVIAYEMARRRV